MWGRDDEGVEVWRETSQGGERREERPGRGEGDGQDNQEEGDHVDEG